MLANPATFINALLKIAVHLSVSHTLLAHINNSNKSSFPIFSILIVHISVKFQSQNSLVTASMTDTSSGGVPLWLGVALVFVGMMGRDMFTDQQAKMIKERIALLDKKKPFRHHPQDKIKVKRSPLDRIKLKSLSRRFAYLEF